MALTTEFLIEPLLDLLLELQLGLSPADFFQTIGLCGVLKRGEGGGGGGGGGGSSSLPV